MRRPTTSTARFHGTLLACALALAACGYSKPNPTPINYGGLGSGGVGDVADIGRLGGEDSGVLVGNTKKSGSSDAGSGGTGIGVNAYLWRGALDTLGFMPLNSVDPFGGVIITDWYTPAESPNERMKVQITILDRELRADGVRVAVFKQQTSPKGGAWVDAQVDPRTNTEIENAILTRARQLRIAQGG